jgi:hypothetical protein
MGEECFAKFLLANESKKKKKRRRKKRRRKRRRKRRGRRGENTTISRAVGLSLESKSSLPSPARQDVKWSSAG